MTRTSIAPAVLAATLLAAGCGGSHAKAGAPAPVTTTPPTFTVEKLPLPGADPAAGVFLDYIAYDAATNQVWVPAGSTGSVDVIDAATGKLTRIAGFATQEMERKGKKRMVGPSSATVAPGAVYVGNRGDSTVCRMDEQTLAKGACVTLASMPDGLAYVAATHEVWVTTPRDQSITILDVSAADALTVKDTLKFDGEPEGFAVDEATGIFYTNLEDKDKTLAIDVHDRHTISTWEPKCGEDGPKGISLAKASGALLVACMDAAISFDLKDGKILSRIEAGGEGVDDLGFSAARSELALAAGKAAKLTLAHLDAKGVLTPVAVVTTTESARNPVIDAAGKIYLTDGKLGQVLIVSPGK
jgi:DNA-binding beta-propeller fold protein YncE